MEASGTQGQRGSALLLVVFMILLFTMLGIAIIGATVGGAQRSATREKDVQSLHLAEMALNEAAARVAAYFEGREDIDLDTLPDDLAAIKAQINAGKERSSDLGREAWGRIESFEPDGGEDGQPIGGVKTKDFTIKVTAKANVDGVVRTLAQDIVVNTYPEFLKYAFGSEEEVYLNGAPYFLGNVYAGGKLWIQNHAEYVYRSNAGREATAFPTVAADSYLYLQDENSVRVCKDAARCNSAAGDYETVPVKQTNVDALQTIIGLPLDRFQFRSRKKFVSMNVAESFKDKLAEAIGAPKPTSGDSIGGLLGQFPTSRIMPTTKPVLSEDPNKDPTDEQIAAFEEEMRRYSLLNGEALTESVLFPGNLLIDGGEFQKILYSESAKASRPQNGNFYKSNWLVVGGDLTIDNSYAGSDHPMEIRGNMLVTGNVWIKGEVKMDATIIALGGATIEDATIYPLDGRELLLISKGKVLINRVDAFNPIGAPFGQDAAPAAAPAILNAFFYTDDEAELYGVGSAFWIKGGFFAKKSIRVNAVLGNTAEGAEDLIFDVKNDFPLDRGFETSEPTRLQSRFIVAYNDKIYQDQYVGLPRVDQINITVGKKRFADALSEGTSP
ncbi:hypothetical protein [Cohnella sp. REN36]|uniref:hypothetical protein n=1 Tax=Cohnella sp. REN36 TaxID=2887347 RepID=UPI001D14E95C|nr:hypothetical protein [Cohnella sp. REN36]MCC3374618.1 hypothetical protein [Cohnella sp. REN36]